MEPTERAGRQGSPSDEVNKRACDVCHGMKVKCIKDSSKPPCKRCRGLGIECTFDRSRVSVPLRTDKERILALEGHMAAVRSMLDTMMGLLEKTASQTAEIAAATAQRPPTLEQWVDTVGNTLPGPPLPAGAGSMGGVASAAHPGPAPMTALGAPSSTNRSPVRPPELPEAGQGHPYEDDYDYDSQGDMESDSGSVIDSEEQEENTESRSERSSPELPELAEEERRLPLRSLLYEEEARRLRNDGHDVEHDSDHDSDSRIVPRKRRRSASASEARPDNSPVAKSTGGSAKTPGSGIFHTPMIPQSVKEATDPIDLGIVTEAEGRRLFELFFQGASAYVPVFDPEIDTFDSIRDRTPLCLTAILMIGQMSSDAGVRAREPSGTRLRLKHHAEKLATATLFSPIASIQIVQALILLASWGDTVWRPGNHALSIAVDMGLYRCLSHLISTGMGRGKSATELERDRGYVVGARVWLALTKLKLEMALNHGRPILLPVDEPLETSRRLLEHPLSISNDSRCIAACEIMTHRQRQVETFARSKNFSAAAIDDILLKGNATFDEWENFWKGYYARNGVGSDNFLVSELAVQKCHSILHFNYHVLHGVHAKADVACLPESRRHWLVTSLNVADSLVARMAQREALAQLKFANHYAFVALAFAAQYLIRLARILPGILDMPRTVKNVIALADKLDQFPGFNFRTLLHTVATRARRRANIPSRSVSPQPAPLELSRLEGMGALGMDMEMPLDIQMALGMGADLPAGPQAYLPALDDVDPPGGAMVEGADIGLGDHADEDAWLDLFISVPPPDTV